MNLIDSTDRFLGQWTGTKELYFTGPPEPDNVSDSELEVRLVAKDNFLSFAYTWAFKEARHEGFLLVGSGNTEGIATAAWVDSFHMSGKIMHCVGEVDEQGRVNVMGSYEAPPGPDWGWRIELSSDDIRLEIVMHNISPDGEAVLAVRASFVRPRLDAEAI